MSEEGSSYLDILGDDAVDEALRKGGFATPSSFEFKTIPAVRSGKDAVVEFSEAGSSGRSVIAAYLYEKLNSTSKGVSINVAGSAAAGKKITSDLTKVGIKVGSASSPSEDDEVIVGTASDVKDYFESEVCRATSISRVVFEGITEADFPDVRNVLASASKRGRRPQLILFTESITPQLNELIRGYFQASAFEVSHLYFEVGPELLDKPKALSDLIESEGCAKALIFCNQPSEADFVEAMLRRSGIAARKLIGNVPSQKVAQVMGQIESGSLRALVVTDISARTIEAGFFEIVFNYAIHNDPEVYVNRTHLSGPGNLRKIISLVGPLDRANFHYLKKILEFTFDKIEAPDRSAIIEARVRTIREAALKVESTDSDVAEIAQKILSAPSPEKVLAFLLSSYFSAAQSSSEGMEESSYRDRDGDSRGRNSRDRDGRDDSRRRGRGRDSSYDGDDERPRRERRPEAPRARISRLYIGRGRKEGISEESLNSSLRSDEAFEERTLKRMNVRDNYAFLDLDDAVADAALRSLQETMGDGVVIKKALTLNQPRPNDAMEGEGVDGDNGMDSPAMESGEEVHESASVE